MNKNTHEEKHVLYVQGAAKYIKNKKTHVVSLTGEAIRRYTLPRSDLGATTAKIQLPSVSKHINSIAGCSFMSYT